MDIKLISTAYNNTKGVGDPEYHQIKEINFLEKLEAHAVAVEQTDIAISPFELEVQKLLSAPPETEKPVKSEHVEKPKDVEAPKKEKPKKKK